MFFGNETGIELGFLGPWHLIQILITALVIYLIIRYKVQLRNSKYEHIVRYAMGAAIIFLQMGFYVWKASVGEMTLLNTIPLGVCVINMYVSVYIVFTKNEKVFYLIYFWGLGALLSVFFPDIAFGPDRFRYYQFFYSHMMFLWIYMYMIFVHGYRPTLKHLRTSALLLFIIAVGIALPLSYILDHNFMFMYNAGGTPLEILEPLGPVIYLIGTVIAILLTMLIYYAPIYFFVIRKEQKSDIN